MAEYIITKKSNLVAVADSIRERTGGTGKITLGEMIDDINHDIGGVELPELTNEGTASDLLAGKQLIDQEGNIVEGTIATKTSSNLTASGATVTVPAGYYASQATKSVATATQATPSVSIDSAGKITASATQTAGYVSAGTKTGTKQLTTQAAKTITPSKSSQTAVVSGVYTTGAVTVAGDSNLVAGNIKSGVSIFGVSGNYVGSGGGDTSIEDGLINRTISGIYSNDRITTIGSHAFYYCKNLTEVYFPNVTSIGSSIFFGAQNLTVVSFGKLVNISEKMFHQESKLTTAIFPSAKQIGIQAFSSCYTLANISFPETTSIFNSAFCYCSSLTAVYFPKVITISSGAFQYCMNLSTASFPKINIMCSSVFNKCYNLKYLYLTNSRVCTLSNSNAFSSTPIGGYSTSAGTYGSIYVPASLLTSYQTATNWAYFSSRFVGI